MRDAALALAGDQLTLAILRGRPAGALRFRAADGEVDGARVPIVLPRLALADTCPERFQQLAERIDARGDDPRVLLEPWLTGPADLWQPNLAAARSLTHASPLLSVPIGLSLRAFGFPPELLQDHSAAQLAELAQSGELSELIESGAICGPAGEFDVDTLVCERACGRKSAIDKAPYEHVGLALRYDVLGDRDLESRCPSAGTAAGTAELQRLDRQADVRKAERQLRAVRKRLADFGVLPWVCWREDGGVVPRGWESSSRVVDAIGMWQRQAVDLRRCVVVLQALARCRQRRGAA